MRLTLASALLLVTSLAVVGGCGNPVRAPRQPATTVADGQWVRVRLDGWFEAVFPMRVEESYLEPSEGGLPFEMRQFASTTNAGFMSVTLGESDDGWDVPKEEALRVVVEAAASDGAVLSQGAYGHYGSYIGAQFTVEVPPHTGDNTSDVMIACRVRAFVDDTRLLLGTFCGRPETLATPQFEAMMASFNPL